MKIKTSELKGATLDWAVAKCEDRMIECLDDKFVLVLGRHDEVRALGENIDYSPSTDWAQGGPIIEREKITIHALNGSPTRWVAHTQDMRIGAHTDGHCPLTAAMRCYVASKLGDDVSVPEELI